MSGLNEDLTPDEYAQLVADKVRQNVRDALTHVGEDAVLAAPDAVASALVDTVLWVRAEMPNELVARLAPFWSGAKACEALGLRSRQALAERRRHGSVLGLKTADHRVVFPVFQFQRRDGRIEVKPQLRPVLRALKEFDPWAVAVLLRTPAPELLEITPMDWVSQGRDPRALAELGRAVAREWGAGAV